jgi:hypothetical protein
MQIIGGCLSGWPVITITSFTIQNRLPDEWCLGCQRKRLMCAVSINIPLNLTSGFLHRKTLHIGPFETKYR